MKCRKCWCRRSTDLKPGCSGLGWGDADPTLPVHTPGWVVWPVPMCTCYLLCACIHAGMTWPGRSNAGQSLTVGLHGMHPRMAARDGSNHIVCRLWLPGLELHTPVLCKSELRKVHNFCFISQDGRGKLIVNVQTCRSLRSYFLLIKFVIVQTRWHEFSKNNIKTNKNFDY